MAASCTQGRVWHVNGSQACSTILSSWSSVGSRHLAQNFPGSEPCVPEWKPLDPRGAPPQTTARVLHL
jgi:hypothetical protein